MPVLRFFLPAAESIGYYLYVVVLTILEFFTVKQFPILISLRVVYELVWLFGILMYLLLLV